MYILSKYVSYIGIYGNADPLDISQWLSLPLSIPTSTSTWSDTTGTCSKLLTNLNYQFLIAKSGEYAYPQNKIVSATIQGQQASWTSA